MADLQASLNSNNRSMNATFPQSLIFGVDGKSAYEIAVENGFEGTAQEWLESMKGADGETPYIGENGNWWIGETDAGVKATGADGKDGIDGTTPQLRINTETNEWEVSLDNGTTWESTGVVATGEKGEKGDQGEQGEKGEKGDASGTTRVLLWENPTPANFSAQIVSLDLSLYDGIDILYAEDEDPSEFSVHTTGFIPTDLPYAYVYYKMVTRFGAERLLYVNNTGVVFRIGYDADDRASSTAAIPIRIYGIKGVQSAI